MIDFERLFTVLDEHDVAFILVGGVAATVHGSARLTRDLDVVYRRTDENIERLVRALAPFEPYPRGAPPGLPFHWDVETIQGGLNFTLSTTLGAVDLFGEITGGGRYEDLRPNTVEITVFGVRCRCVSLAQLIQLKRAAGRPRDFEALAELEAIRAERDEDVDG